MTTNKEFSLYRELVEAGVEVANHESDLYFPKTDETVEIVKRYPFKRNVTTFRDNKTGEIWCDAPFAYDPWWKKAEESVVEWADRLKNEA